MKYVLIGKIVNTHGLKGEVRVLSTNIYKDRIFKKGMKIYIGKEKKEEVINSYRFHKIFDMITMKGYSYIDEVLKYKGEYLFVNKDDIVLYENEYLDEDIIGLNVFCDNNLIGKVVRIDEHSKNRLLVVKNNEKNFYVPYNFDIIDNVDLKEKRLVVKNILGLF